MRYNAGVKLRNALTVVGVAGLIILAWVVREDIAEAIGLIRDFNWLILLLLVPLLLFSYLVRAWFYQSILAHFGHRVDLKRLYGMSWAVNFATLALPSAGISAATIVGTALKKSDVPSGSAAMVQLAKYGMTYASFVFVLLVALIFVIWQGQASSLVLQSVGLIAISIVLLTSVLIYMLYNQKAFSSFVELIQRTVDMVSRYFRNGEELIGVERLHEIMHDFYHSFHVIMEKRLYYKRPFIFALTGNVVEVLLLYIFFVAIGFIINPAVVVIAYALAVSTGFVSIVPGDVGVYEVVMVAVLTASGVPLAVGLSATIMYRVFARFAFLPLGFYFYNYYIREE